MTRGFVISAQNTTDVNYIKCATTLAQSIKKFMPKEKVVLITCDLVDNSSKKYFDQIVKLPHGDLAPNSSWKLINDYQVYEASPFDETIKLEADMYVTRDITHWFDTLSINDITVCTNIRNFKQELSDIRVYRKFIDDNFLPDTYNAMTYFKKSVFSENFFKIIYSVFENWEQIKKNLKCNINEIVTTDWAYSIACHVLGEEKTTLPFFKDFSFVHMKQYINGLPTDKWTDTLVYESLPQCLRINTIPQLYPLHYVIKDFSSKLNDAR